MRGVISLLREPDDRYWLSSPPPEEPKPPGSEEPAYFVALLEYLRERRQELHNEGQKRVESVQDGEVNDVPEQNQTVQRKLMHR